MYERRALSLNCGKGVRSIVPTECCGRTISCHILLFINFSLTPIAYPTFVVHMCITEKGEV